MSGPEHYREAERYAEIATEHADGSPGQMSALASGQLHATLALAAATALPPRTFLTTEFRDQLAAPWLEAAG